MSCSGLPQSHCDDFSDDVDEVSVNVYEFIDIVAEFIIMRSSSSKRQTAGERSSAAKLDDEASGGRRKNWRLALRASKATKLRQTRADASAAPIGWGLSPRFWTPSWLAVRAFEHRHWGCQPGPGHPKRPAA